MPQVFIPATLRTIAPGACVSIRYPHAREGVVTVGTVQEAHSARRRGWTERRFTLKRDDTGAIEYHVMSNDSPLEFYVQVDQAAACAAVMRELRTRAKAVPPLGESVKLAGGPFNGQRYNPRSHESTLVIECNGQRGKYARIAPNAWQWSEA
jgi:hypothetical protein